MHVQFTKYQFFDSFANLLLIGDGYQNTKIEIVGQAHTFWNLYQPGADEHYLYDRIKKPDHYIPQLCLVAQIQNQIVGQIIAYKTEIYNQNQSQKAVTFGPVSVNLQYQGKGIGQQLITHFLNIAKQIGQKVVIIQGYPSFYKKIGFKDSKQFDISDQEGNFSYGLLVYELEQGYLKDKKGNFINRIQYQIDSEELSKFDQPFPPKQKFQTKNPGSFCQNTLFISK